MHPCSIPLPASATVACVFRYSTTFTIIPSFQYSITPMARPLLGAFLMPPAPLVVTDSPVLRAFNKTRSWGLDETSYSVGLRTGLSPVSKVVISRPTSSTDLPETSMLRQP